MSSSLSNRTLLVCQPCNGPGYTSQWIERFLNKDSKQNNGLLSTGQDSASGNQQTDIDGFIDEDNKHTQSTTWNSDQDTWVLAKLMLSFMPTFITNKLLVRGWKNWCLGGLGHGPLTRYQCWSFEEVVYPRALVDFAASNLASLSWNPIRSKAKTNSTNIRIR